MEYHIQDIIENLAR